MLTGLNDKLFLMINGPAHPSALALGWALICANGLIYAAVVLFLALWVWGRRDARAGLLATALAVLGGLLANQVLGALWYEPRPFMIGLGHGLAHHVADNSFPSDHGTVLWALGFALILTGASSLSGALMVMAGFLVAWARIYLGIHFPIDMATSFLIGIAAGVSARAIMPAGERWLLPPAERGYDAVLQRLGLSGFSPR